MLPSIKRRRDKERWGPGHKIKKWSSSGWVGLGWWVCMIKDKMEGKETEWYWGNAVASRISALWDKSLIIQMKTICFWMEERRARQTGKQLWFITGTPKSSPSLSWARADNDDSDEADITVTSSHRGDNGKRSLCLSTRHWSQSKVMPAHRLHADCWGPVNVLSCRVSRF